MQKAQGEYSTLCVALAADVRGAEAEYRDILAAVPDVASRPDQDENVRLDATAERRRVACLALAAAPAASLADVRAKASVLLDAVQRTRGRPAEVVDEEGLVVSLLDDLLRLAA